jgi:hypothetical protein
VPSLNTLATQSEPSFLATQLIVMVIFHRAVGLRDEGIPPTTTSRLIHAPFSF